MADNSGTELVPFNGDQIRTIEYEGRTIAYMPDVAKALDLRPNNVIRGLDPWDYVTLDRSDLSGLFDPADPRERNPSPYWLTESGIWHLSYTVSPELRRKVNEEILPAMRRGETLTYTPVPKAIELQVRQYDERAYRRREKEWNKQSLHENPRTGEITPLPVRVVELTPEAKEFVTEVVKKEYPADQMASLIRRQTRKEDDSPYR